MIISAEKSNCPAIAELHIDQIRSGFLSRIGDRFLIQLYEAMQASRYGVLLISKTEDDSIDGFVSASLNTRKFYIDFLPSKHFFKSIPGLFGFVFSRKISRGADHNKKLGSFLKKCSETLIYPFKQKKEKAYDAELLSIVVNKNSRGKGIAGALLEELKSRFIEQGVDRFKVVVGADNTRACRFYEKNGGRLVKRIEVHRGEMSNVYLFDPQITQIIEEPDDRGQTTDVSI